MLFEKYLGLSEAAELLPGRVSRVTLWRWARQGLSDRSGKKIRLRHIRIGRKMLVCPEDLLCFFELVAQGDEEGSREQGAGVQEREQVCLRSGDVDKNRIEQPKRRLARRARHDIASSAAEAERLGI